MARAADPRTAAVGAVLLGSLALANQAIPALPGLPLDPTLILMLLSAVVAFGAWASRRFYIGPAHWALIGLALTFAPGLYLAHGPYSAEKVAGMTLGFLAAAASIELLRTDVSRKAFAGAIAMIGAGSAVAVVIFGRADPLSGRVSVAGLSPLGIGFSSAVAALVWFIAAGRPGVAGGQRVLLLGVAALCAYGAVKTGSRGPLAAAALAAALTYLLSRAPGRWARLSAVLAAIGSTFLLLGTSTALYANRLLASDVSSENRLKLWGESAAAGWGSIAGAGWGDMVEHVQVPLTYRIIAGDRQYSHNLLLEVLVEGGWIALLGLVAVLIVSWRALRPASTTVPGQMMLALWVFAIATASTSGDLAGNRLVWLAVGAGLATLATARHPGSAGGDQWERPRVGHQAAGRNG